MSDDPLQRGTPPGSLRYFAVLYAPAAARPLLSALYAFDAEIRDTARASTHDVAHTRLQYWRGEVDRLVAGKPGHPVTKALLSLRDCGADLTLLHEVLVAADIDLAHVTLNDEDELAAFAFRAGGAVQTLAAIASRSSAQLTRSESEFARRLGAAVAEVEWLRDLRGDAVAGRLRLPLDALAHAGVAPAELLLEPPPASLAQMLAARKARLGAELQALSRVLDRAERNVQRQGLVLAALHARLLDRIDHSAGIARTRAEVPPWPRFWTAWRTAIRHA
jgi:15-cis-phytoene synthase